MGWKLHIQFFVIHCLRGEYSVDEMWEIKVLFLIWETLAWKKTANSLHLFEEANSEGSDLVGIIG